MIAQPEIGFYNRCFGLYRSESEVLVEASVLSSQVGTPPEAVQFKWIPRMQPRVLIPAIIRANALLQKDVLVVCKDLQCELNKLKVI